jgi:hypothetical protein
MALLACQRSRRQFAGTAGAVSIEFGCDGGHG